MAAPVIEARGIVKRYGDVTALGGVDLTVEEGTVLGLLGPNGAGKTTLVRVLTTLLLPDEGTATVAGFDVRTQPQQVRGSVGLAGQFAAVDPLLTGRENIELVGRLYGLPAAEARRRAVRLLERLSLSDDADRLVRGYSGGMRRRLDLGASLVGEPRILVLDEPTTGLDPQARAAVWDLARELSAAGVSIVLTTHLLEEAERMADHVVIIDHGRVVAAGSVDELVEASGGSQIVLRTEPGLALGSLLDLLPGGCHVAESAPGRYVVDGPVDTGTTQVVDQWCRDRGVVPLELGLRARSLEDVFLDLTGREVRT